MIAVLADIHADHIALADVLADIHARGIKRIWCLGDIAGAHGNVLESWRMIRDSEIVLAGNHDQTVQGGRSARFNRFGENAAAALREAQNYLIGDAQYMALTAKRKTTLGSGTSVLCSHASPVEPWWEFIDSPEKARAAFRYADWARIILSGHTHKPLLADDAGGYETKPDKVVFQLGQSYLLNPGAVLHDRRWLELDEGGAVWHQAPTHATESVL